MNEQTKPIDVLAVMMVAAEVAASNGLNYTHDGLRDARAAIAELIEAHRNLLENPAIRVANFYNAEVDFAYKRARTALANVSGVV